MFLNLNTYNNYCVFCDCVRVIIPSFLCNVKDLWYERLHPIWKTSTNTTTKSIVCNNYRRSLTSTNECVFRWIVLCRVSHPHTLCFQRLPPPPHPLIVPNCAWQSCTVAPRDTKHARNVQNPNKISIVCFTSSIVIGMQILYSLVSTIAPSVCVCVWQGGHFSSVYWQLTFTFDKCVNKCVNVFATCKNLCFVWFKMLFDLNFPC